MAPATEKRDTSGAVNWSYWAERFGLPAAAVVALSWFILTYVFIPNLENENKMVDSLIKSNEEQSAANKDLSSTMISVQSSLEDLNEFQKAVREERPLEDSVRSEMLRVMQEDLKASQQTEQLMEDAAGMMQGVPEMRAKQLALMETMSQQMEQGNALEQETGEALKQLKPILEKCAVAP